MKLSTALNLAALALVALAAHFGLVSHELALPLAFVGMAFPADAIDVVDLRALTDGGFVRESLYKTVFFLQTVADTPFMNLVATETVDSDKHEWTFDDVRVPSTSNAKIAGDNPASPKAATGSRVINRAQICDGYITVSSTARASATQGNGDQLAYETHKEIMAIRQDVEAIALTHQASVVGNNSNTAQKTAGLSAWIATNDDFGSGGASGGYNTSTHVVDAPTVGVGRALSWAKVTAQLLNLFNKRANTQYAMSTGALIQGINQAIVAGTIKVATPQATMSANNPPAAQTGQGWFSGIISDFGFQITFVPNRTQQTYTGGGTSSNVATCVDLFLLDPGRVSMAYLVGYNVVDLGKVSALHDDRHLAVEWLTKPYREDAHAVIRDLKPSTAVTA